MRFPIDGRLIAEAERYRLRSACRHCLYQIPDDGRCAHGWPNDEQRHDVADAARAGSVAFCKEFELA